MLSLELVTQPKTVRPSLLFQRHESINPLSDLTRSANFRLVASSKKTKTKGGTSAKKKHKKSTPEVLPKATKAAKPAQETEGKTAETAEKPAVKQAAKRSTVSRRLQRD